jgi:hypothetical protein
MAGGHSWARATLGVVAGLASSLWLAPPADAAGPGIFSSINLGFSNAISPHAAGRMASGGVRSVRFALNWFGIEATQGRYDWGETDALIGNLAANGIRPLPILFGTPQWAVAQLPPTAFSAPTGGDTAYPPVMTPKASRAWSRFVRAAARRYGPHGAYWSRVYPSVHPGARPLPVGIWQIWNEPNIDRAFWPSASVSRYGALVKLSARSIHAVDPTAEIALAGVPGHVEYHGKTFLNQLYARVPGIKRYFDIVAFHPYARTVNGVLLELHHLRRMLRHRDPRVRLWISEIGWGSARPDRFLNMGRVGQARKLRKLFSTLEREHARLPVWRVSWFDWRDPQAKNPACEWCTRSGLIDWRGHKKPAWDAYRSFVSR